MHYIAILKLATIMSSLFLRLNDFEHRMIFLRVFQLYRRSLDTTQMPDTIVPTQALRQEVLNAVQHEVGHMDTILPFIVLYNADSP